MPKATSEKPQGSNVKVKKSPRKKPQGASFKAKIKKSSPCAKPRGDGVTAKKSPREKPLGAGVKVKKSPGEKPQGSGVKRKKSPCEKPQASKRRKTATPFDSDCAAGDSAQASKMGGLFSYNQETPESRFSPQPGTYQHEVISYKEKRVKNDGGDSHFDREVDIVAKTSNFPITTIRNILNEIQTGSTVPFLVRYRQSIVKQLTAEDVRRIVSLQKMAKVVIEKSKTLKRKKAEHGELTPDIESYIDSITSVEVVEEMLAHYKEQKVNSQKVALDHGYDKVVSKLINGAKTVPLQSLVDKNVPCIDTADKAEKILWQTLANSLMSDEDFYNWVDLLKSHTRNTISSVVRPKGECINGATKLKKYFAFTRPVDKLLSHDILAMNRGENLKILKVTVNLAPSLLVKIERRMSGEFHQLKMEHSELFQNALKLLMDKMAKRAQKMVRKQLSAVAEEKAISVFSSNLKYMLLTPPLKSRSNVLGLDPGFKNGCKTAVVVPTSGAVAHTETLFLNPHEKFKTSIKMLIDRFEVEFIALGNGCGSKQVQIKLADILKPYGTRVKYFIVPEQGASIYSCSPEATQEYPHLTPNVISAVSLAKRLINPLFEYVKVEPRHLGVGMYQLDMDEKKLTSSLDEVVSECVSEVGVDINTVPLYILRHVAGLTENRAQLIISARDKCRGFLRRADIQDVKGIGPKTYQQCAGFVKILDHSAPSSRTKGSMDPLDKTIIHPENYGTVLRLIKEFHLDLSHLGSDEFIKTFRTKRLQFRASKFIQENEISESTYDMIVTALETPTDHDIRDELGVLFAPDLLTIDDLRIGQELTGKVCNVTTFGTFVDIGVHVDGLIPHTGDQDDVHYGDIVKVAVHSIEDERICLKLICRLENQVRKNRLKDC